MLPKRSVCCVVGSDLFGIALVTPDGKVYTAGDVSSEVSIQSVSKVFTMAPHVVFDRLLARLLDHAPHKGLEMNALVNPGASRRRA